VKNVTFITLAAGYAAKFTNVRRNTNADWRGWSEDWRKKQSLPRRGQSWAKTLNVAVIEDPHRAGLARQHRHHHGAHKESLVIIQGFHYIRFFSAGQFSV
jgi:hypothetical protein